jgi:broad specificity phosphatase PhoE
MKTTLVLIRHGITAWNKEKRYCGCKDVGLSNEGKSQARGLRNKIGMFNFKNIYCSQKKRAIQTARIIFEHARIYKIKGLNEINFGILEGLKHERILQEHPVVYKKWLKDPFRNNIPKAESLKSFRERVITAVDKIIKANRGETAALVCHGGTIAVFISSIIKSKNFWRCIPKSASLTVVERKRGAFKLKSLGR